MAVVLSGDTCQDRCCLAHPTVCVYIYMALMTAIIFIAAPFAVGCFEFSEFPEWDFLELPLNLIAFFGVLLLS